MTATVGEVLTGLRFAFKGPLNLSGAVAGDVLTKQADGSWVGAGLAAGAVVCAADGTASLPGIAFNDEKTTGFYRPGSNRIGVPNVLEFEDTADPGVPAAGRVRIWSEGSRLAFARVGGTTYLSLDANGQLGANATVGGSNDGSFVAASFDGRSGRFHIVDTPPLIGISGDAGSGIAWSAVGASPAPQTPGAAGTLLQQSTTGVVDVNATSGGVGDGALRALRLQGGDPVTDVDPAELAIKAANAWPQATTGDATDGADVLLAGGIGRRLYTVVDFTNGTGDTATVTVDGVATVLTEGADFDSVGSDAATATDLALAIDAISGVSAIAVGTSVFVTPDGDVRLMFVATGDATAWTVTSGADGDVRLPSGVSLISDATLTLVGETPGSEIRFIGGTAQVSIASLGMREFAFSQWLLEAGATGGLRLADDAPIRWFDGNVIAGSADVGLERDSSGILQVTDGSTGQGSLELLNLLGRDATTDVAVSDLEIRGATALPAATAGQQDGANVIVRPGENATGGGADGRFRVIRADGGAGFVELYDDGGGQAFLEATTSALRLRSGNSVVSIDDDLGDGLAANWHFDSDRFLKLAKDYGVEFGSAGTVVGGTSNMASRFRGGIRALVDEVATTVATVDVQAGEMAGGVIEYSIRSTDGTDHQVLSGSVTWSVVNKAGTLTGSISASGTDSTALSAGTLTVAWTLDLADSTVEIRANANTSLTPSTFEVRFQVHNCSPEILTMS